MRSPLHRIVKPILLLVAIGLCAGRLVDFFTTVAIAESPRIAWTSSRIVGSPDPPLPFVLRRDYQQLEFDKPVSIHAEPVSGPKQPRRLWVCQQDGKIFSFAADGEPTTVALVADLTADPPPRSDLRPEDSKQIQIYSLAFHPNFLKNRKVVVCYVVTAPGKRRPDGTHIASFEVSRDTNPVLLPETETTILTFDSGGHNGCTVAFDNDGLLYISTGDVASPSPPDSYDHGQNVGDIYAAILRVDIDQPAPDAGYSIPADNPFIDLPDARPEVYAYGFRNPWRFSFDRPTGDLWVGDVGWEAWEMVYRVRSGGNYGWPIKEGPGDVRGDVEPGPTPISPPDVALPHAEAASVTGGVVYRGERYPTLAGQYVFGDWITRKFWAVEFDESSVLAVRELAVGNVKPICFELDHDGELLILDYNSSGKSGIYRLQPNPAPREDLAFPRRLSETGLVAETSPLTLAPGVVRYEIQAPMYRDGATAEYWLAIPGTGQAEFFAQPQVTFDWFRTGVILPPGSVLAKTYRLPRVAGDPETRRPIETQIAHTHGLGDWEYLTFRWNDDASDAELVAAGGEITTFQVADPAEPDGSSELAWTFAARTQCRTCHTPWRGETLGFIESQLRRADLARPRADQSEPLGDSSAGPDASHDGQPASDGQPDDHPDAWQRLLAGGWIRGDHAADVPSAAPPLVDPHDPAAPLGLRARSYLHANCAHCHLNGGNASVALDVSLDKSIAETGLIDALAMRGDGQLDHGKLVAPGAPERSVLLYRVAKLGSARMPPINTNRVDLDGVVLLQRWIERLPEEHSSVSRSETSRGQRRRLRQLIDLAGKTPATDDLSAEAEAGITGLLADTSGALLLATAMADGQIPATWRHTVTAMAMSRPPAIADLFEPWVTAAERVPRLGPDFDPQEVLSLAGDADSGRQAFVAGLGQCAQCHRIHGHGSAVGPDLSKIGTKYPQPAELLRHIVDPSAKIEPAYQGEQLLTDSGRVLVGRVVESDGATTRLQDAAGRLWDIESAEIIDRQPLRQSLMPEQLLDSLTARQAADLLAYLSALR